MFNISKYFNTLLELNKYKNAVIKFIFLFRKLFPFRFLNFLKCDTLLYFYCNVLYQRKNSFKFNN